MTNAKSVQDAQSVFDALDAYMQGTDWVSSTASASFDGGGSTHTMNCSDRNSQNTFTYSQRTAGIKVTVQPMGASLGPGQTQQFTATAANPDGSVVAGAAFTWSMGPGALGSVTASGLYSAPAAIAAQATDTVTATLTGQQSWASTTMQLHP